jgi:hypothetical protein
VTQEQQLVDDTTQSETPDEDEKRPAPRPAQADERYWGVGPGDEEEYRKMVEVAEEPFEPFILLP